MNKRERRFLINFINYSTIVYRLYYDTGAGRGGEGGEGVNTSISHRGTATAHVSAHINANTYVR